MPNELKPLRAIIGARGGGKVLMANAMKETAIKRGEKIIVVRKGVLKRGRNRRVDNDWNER